MELNNPESTIYSGIRHSIRAHLLLRFHQFGAQCSSATPPPKSARLIVSASPLDSLGSRNRWWIRDRKGFTLLELMISLALSAILLLVLVAAMRMSYKSQEKGYEKAETTQKIRILGDRITWLIRGVYPFVAKRPEGTEFYFKGESDSIGFVTTSVDYFGKGPEDIAGLKWVSIFSDNEGLKIREKVFFLEDIFDDSDGKLYVLDPEVTDLEFEYFDIPEDETQGNWVSSWDPDDKEYLPSAVKVRIKFKHNEKSISLPEIIVSINAYYKEEF